MNNLRNERLSYEYWTAEADILKCLKRNSLASDTWIFRSIEMLISQKQAQIDAS